MHDYKTVSIYSFHSLRQAIAFFEARGVDLNTVFIEGSFGGSSPTEDDDPVFTWEHPPTMVDDCGGLGIACGGCSEGCRQRYQKAQRQ